MDGDLSGGPLILKVGDGIVELVSVFSDEDGVRSLDMDETPVRTLGVSVGASGLLFALVVGRGGSTVDGGLVVGRVV